MNDLPLEQIDAKGRQPNVCVALALCFALGVIIGMLSKL